MSTNKFISLLEKWNIISNTGQVKFIQNVLLVHLTEILISTQAQEPLGPSGAVSHGQGIASQPWRTLLYIMNPQLSSKCASTLLKQYSREFIMKVHPDRHHSNPEAQLANSTVVSLINHLFQSDPPEVPPQLHPLCFYLKQADVKPEETLLKRCKNLKFKLVADYLIVNYALFHQIPHSSASLQSAINLFSATGVQVDKSSFHLESEKANEVFNETNTSSLLQSSIARIGHDFQLSKQELKDLRLFLHNHSNIIIIDGSNAEVLALLALLRPAIESLTASSSTTPLFIFNAHCKQPVFDEKQIIYHLPSDISLFPSNYYMMCLLLIYCPFCLCSH